MKLIDNLDSKSNLNGMTKREILFELIKTNGDVDKSITIIHDMEKRAIISFNEIETKNKIEMEENKKEDNLIISLDQLDIALKNKKMEIANEKNSIDNILGNSNLVAQYSNLKKDLNIDEM